jgi:hypothetical protein
MIDSQKISSNPRNASPIFSELYKRFEFWMVTYQTIRMLMLRLFIDIFIEMNYAVSIYPSGEITNVYRNFVLSVYQYSSPLFIAVSIFSDSIFYRSS